LVSHGKKNRKILLGFKKGLSGGKKKKIPHGKRRRRKGGGTPCARKRASIDRSKRESQHVVKKRGGKTRENTIGLERGAKQEKGKRRTDHLEGKTSCAFISKQNPGPNK